MANDNETVNEIRAEVGEYLTSIGPSELPSETQVEEFADRFASAHEREMNALAAQKTAEAHEAFVKNAELAEAIAAKDAEIASLRLLVKELADALLAAYNDTCDYCKKHLNIGDASALICLNNRQFNVGQAYGRLVAKAREAVK